MANPFVHSYTQSVATSPEAKRIPVWDQVDETYNGGATLAVNTTTQKVGTIIPAGTPVTVSASGVTVGGNSPTGLTWHDAQIGENGAPIDIVTRGKLYIDRVDATITSTQKTALASRILFV